jgi:hypothetical protein
MTESVIPATTGSKSGSKSGNQRGDSDSGNQGSNSGNQGSNSGRSQPGLFLSGPTATMPHQNWHGNC